MSGGGLTIFMGDWEWMGVVGGIVWLGGCEGIFLMVAWGWVGVVQVYFVWVEVSGPYCGKRGWWRYILGRWDEWTFFYVWVGVSGGMFWVNGDGLTFFMCWWGWMGVGGGIFWVIQSGWIFFMGGWG